MYSNFKASNSRINNNNNNGGIHDFVHNRVEEILTRFNKFFSPNERSRDPFLISLALEKNIKYTLKYTSNYEFLGEVVSFGVPLPTHDSFLDPVSDLYRHPKPACLHYILHEYVYYDNLKAVGFLLDHGADSNALTFVDHIGYHSLHFCQSIEMCEQLTSKGANLFSLKAEEGESFMEEDIGPLPEDSYRRHGSFLQNFLRDYNYSCSETNSNDNKSDDAEGRGSGTRNLKMVRELIGAKASMWFQVWLPLEVPSWTNNWLSLLPKEVLVMVAGYIDHVPAFRMKEGA